MIRSHNISTKPREAIKDMVYAKKIGQKKNMWQLEKKGKAGDKESMRNSGLEPPCTQWLRLYRVV